MKRIDFKAVLSRGRNVYMMAAISLFVTAVAIGIIYSRTVKTIEKNLTFSETTQKVQQNQTGESDPRVTQKSQQTDTTQALTETTVEITTEASETEAVQAEESTTEKSTTAAFEISDSFTMPCEGEIIKGFSPDVPVYSKTMNDWRIHSGIDFAVEKGDEVLSVGNGKVSKVMVDSSYGYTVEIDCGSFTARYCGLEQGSTVKIGQLLNKGDTVGKVGNVPCEANDGVHLHFEIVKDGIYLDPAKEITS